MHKLDIDGQRGICLFDISPAHEHDASLLDLSSKSIHDN